ncbi:MAG: hypothetical protein ACYC23_00715 [Limisphaerales bacterium]
MNSPSNPTPQSGPGAASPISRRFALRRLLRVLLCVAACGATLLALFYVVENWRGKRAWAAYVVEQKAKGVNLDFAPLVPPPVPDEQNFAATPFLAPLFDFEPGTQVWRDRAVSTNRMAFAQTLPDLTSIQRQDWRFGARADWPALLAAFDEQARRAAARTPDPSSNTARTSPVTNRIEAASAVLEALSVYDPVLAELQVASQRPQARFNIRYEEQDPSGILLPHFAVIRSLVRISSLRAGAELALGRTGPALNELELAFHLVDSLREEPLLISQLVRCAAVGVIMQPVWEGLADRKWSEAELRSLDKLWGKFDLLAAGQLAMRGEQAWGNRIIDYVRQHPAWIENLGQVDGDSSLTESSGWFTLIPQGWFYQEQVNYNRTFEEFVRPGVDVEARRVDPRVIAQNERDLQASLKVSGVSRLLGHRVLTSVLTPAIPQAQRRFAHTQTMVDAAVLACALERYRLATGGFPDSLAALTPTCLATPPHDLITGEPLRYRTEDGGFILYSVGWNTTDDGGAVGLSEKGKTNLDLEQGDWVFRVPRPETFAARSE